MVFIPEGEDEYEVMPMNKSEDSVEIPSDGEPMSIILEPMDTIVTPIET